MRQVPAQPGKTALKAVAYLIIGDGRLARHLQAYLGFEALPYSTLSRKSFSNSRTFAAQLIELSNQCTHVLLAISDSAIDPFLREHSVLQEKVCVHFSGALSTPLAASAHPLTTFAGATYSHDRYQEIPFVLEKGRGTFEHLLPGLKNPHYEIASEDKPRYHAWCVISGNFTTLLWEKTFAEFAKLGLPKDVLSSYLNQTSENLEAAKLGESVLTGPFVRDDQATVEKHLKTLGHDPFAAVYRAFLKAYRETKIDQNSNEAASSLNPAPAGEVK